MSTRNAPTRLVSTTLAKNWLSRQLAGALVLRDGGTEPAGLVMTIDLKVAALHDIERDPAARAVWAFVPRARIRRGQVVSIFRFWMARDSYQASSVAQSLCMMAILQHQLTTPSLAMSFWPCREPEAFADVTRAGGSIRITECSGR